jgi:hypothetical protein
VATVNNDDVTWEAPPPSRSGKHGKSGEGVHERIALTLKERPEEWALVRFYANASTASSVASQIRTGTLGADAPRGSYEAASRTTGGRHAVYARYVGERKADSVTHE